MGSFGLVAMFLCTIAVYVSFRFNEQVKKLDLKRRSLLDQKSKVVSDSLQSIKNIKFNGWECLIRDKLCKIRQSDNELLQKNFGLQAVSSAIVALVPSFSALFCIAYVKFVLQKDMRVETIYVIFLYLNYLKKQLIYANLGIVEINSALISFRRISTFLAVKGRSERKETSPKGKRTSADLQYQARSDEAVRVENCTMSWSNWEYESKIAVLLGKGQGNDTPATELKPHEKIS